MPQPPRRTESETQAAVAVAKDAILGRALATQRDLAGAMPEYLGILDTVEASAGVGLHFDEALAGIPASSVDEAARQLLHEVVVAALTSTGAPSLPQRHKVNAAKYEEQFAALMTLGAHFDVGEFPHVEIPSEGLRLDDVDIDTELHRAVEVYRVAEELAEATFQDPRSRALLANVRYKTEEVPALLLAIWKHLAIEMHAKLGSLIEPGLGRKRIKATA